MDLVDTAAMLVDGEGRLIHANPASHALARRIDPSADPAADPQRLLALIQPSNWNDALATGRWSGQVDAGPLRLGVRLYTTARDGRARSLLTMGELSGGVTPEFELQLSREELHDTARRLAGTQEQLLQSEKMASIGQLAAGVAHEINNPIGYVHSNLGTLQEYLTALMALLECHEAALHADDPKAWRADVQGKRERLDIDFIVGDLPKLLEESREGIERVTKIVQDLKDFSRSSGSGEPMRLVDLHKGLESTINIVWNELKYKVQLERHYGNLPPVECHPSEINQVLMTLLINAGQAIDNRGTITITTGCEAGEAWISVADSGCGIAPEVLGRIFEPFFTTKPIGRGTGLGLAVAYNIMAKHHGRIEVSSKPGVGSVFRMVLPVRQPVSHSA
ncbi:ATP-binding protein [Agrilutibacter solisilvae]|nr:ATP-binding protein [Lysobacter solisilvae]